MTASNKSAGSAPVHSGHRKRLRQRFFREGLEQFEDHQVLELLLFHAVPRRDTNEMAHLLLKRFGALSAVLEADPKDLASIPGMGESAVAFLALIPPLTRRYLTDSVSREKPTLNDSKKTNTYLTPLMAGRTEEVFYMLCLDNNCRLLFPALISKGTVNEANIHIRHVVEAALRHKAASVIFAHNHPSGQLNPSRADIQITQIMVSALVPIGIRVLDHVIVAGKRCLSMAAEGLLPNR
ncbi:MAG: DNA repair protein RadC [Magnetococcales bacterium]|nr:DNA repair protein RadC [Magnetococcales bacterium]